MTRKLRTRITLVAGLAVVLLAACSYFPTGGGSQANVGDPIPNFTLNTLDGKPFNMAEQKGKVVLINIFGTW